MSIPTEIEIRHRKQLSTMRGWLDGRRYYLALDALELARSLEKGHRKDGNTPKFHHQLSVTRLLTTLVANFLHPEETLVVALLHDVLEDHSHCVSRADLEERFGERVADAVWHLSKKMGGLTKGYALYFREMGENPIASLVKLADRAHNLQTMQGVFSLGKQRTYVGDLDRWFFPMIKRARRKFPRQYPAYENMKVILRIQRGLLTALIEVQQAPLGIRGRVTHRSFGVGLDHPECTCPGKVDEEYIADRDCTHHGDDARRKQDRKATDELVESMKKLETT